MRSTTIMCLLYSVFCFFVLLQDCSCEDLPLDESGRKEDGGVAVEQQSKDIDKNAKENSSEQCLSPCRENTDCAGCSAGQQTCVRGKCSSYSITPTEVIIQPGKFIMGSSTNEEGRQTDETAHEVTLTNKFTLWKYEVTQGEFQAMMGYNPSRLTSKSCGANCPVELVGWDEATAFCNALSRSKGLAECFDCKKLSNDSDKIFWNCVVKPTYSGSDGRDYYKCKGYRLPTEAEWEYAYRAGTTTAFYNGFISNISCNDYNLDEIGWYCGSNQSGIQSVGQKLPNAWGLYDMAGNVWEWVYDWYADYRSSPAIDPVGPTMGSDRVVRGGARLNFASAARASFRGRSPQDTFFYTGFRPARSLFEK